MSVELAVPEPTAPIFTPPKWGIGPARTPEGGIFINVSDLKQFRWCSQQYFDRRVVGAARREQQDYFTIGGMFGAGCSEWLKSGSIPKAMAAVEEELTERTSPEDAMFPQMVEMQDKYRTVVNNWVRQYAEFYVQPQRDFRVLKNEWIVQVPLGHHRLVMAADSIIEAIEVLGFREGKTTAEKDGGKYVKTYLQNDQILGYSFGFQEALRMAGVEVPAIPPTILDVLVKPRIRDPWGKGWDRYSGAQCEFYRQTLTPNQNQILLWSMQAISTANQIQFLLDNDPDGSKGWWVRNFQNCHGLYQSNQCTFFDNCLQGYTMEDIGLVQRARDYVDYPPLIMEGRKFEKLVVH